jgi:hypothetical protein
MMRKLAGQLGSETEVAERRSRWPAVLMALILFVGLGPLAIEGASMCLGTWKEFMGVSNNVKTPVLDGVQDGLNDVRDLIWGQITPWFRSMPWDPKFVLPAAAVVMAGAMLMLRRN